MRQLCVIAHNMRSTFNVGSLLRTSEGLGIDQVYLTGYTPYPKRVGDTRLPHIADKLDAQIHKTALGAETLINWEHREDAGALLQELRQDGWQLIALELSSDAVELKDFQPNQKCALVLGEEVAGLSKELMELCDKQVFIPMRGKKESFNVVIAASIALYHLSVRME